MSIFPLPPSCQLFRSQLLWCHLDKMFWGDVSSEDSLVQHLSYELKKINKKFCVTNSKLINSMQISNNFKMTYIVLRIFQVKH